MNIKKCNIFLTLLLLFTMIVSFNCVFATTSTTDKLEARLSLWLGDSTLISNKSTTELEAGTKVWIGYKPAENFKSIQCQLNGKVYDFIVKDYNYKSIPITMPDEAGEYKMEMHAVLVNDEKSDNKEYTFKVTKKAEPLEARLSLWLGDSTLINNKATTELEAGTKVWIGYKPGENFKTITCEFNGKTSNYDAKQQNYKSIAVAMPDKAGEYKMKLSAVLVDGTKPENREYTFKVTKKAEPLEARLSLWMSDGKTQIHSKSSTELNVGDKVYVGYNPKENFTTIIYRLIPSGYNLIGATPKGTDEQILQLAEAKAQIVPVKDEAGKYKTIAITMPNDVGEYKLEMSAMLTDGSETETKEYTFKVGKVVEPLEARLSLWMSDGEQIHSRSIHELDAGEKLFVGYNPKENFESVSYRFVGMYVIDRENTTTKSSDAAQVQEDRFLPTNTDLMAILPVKDKNGKYKDLSITLPDLNETVVLEMQATLVDGTKTENKTYTFKLNKADASGESIKAEISLLNDSGTVISPDKAMVTTSEPKLTIKYTPQENFDTIKYQFFPTDEAKTYYPPVETKVKDKDGKYQTIIVTLPNNEGEYKLEVSAVLVDGTKTKVISYNISIVKEIGDLPPINTDIEARLSLWDSNEGLIANKSSVKMNPGDKVFIGCAPKLNFKSVEYKLISLDDKEALSKPVIIILKDKNGVYHTPSIELPTVEGKYKLEMCGSLINNTKTETKEYTFEIIKKQENSGDKANLALWEKDGKTIIHNKSKMTIEAGDKVFIGYNLKENFKTIKYEMEEVVAVSSESSEANAETTSKASSKVYKESKEFKIEKDSKGNYPALSITFPKDEMTVKVKLSAVLVNGNKTTEKEYTFKIVKEDLEARLSLWKDSNTLIKENSTMDINFTDKVYVGYNPKENFKAIEYQFVAVADELGNMPKVAYKSVKVDVKDKDGKYQKIAIEFPQDVSRVKLQIKGILKNDVETMMKEYTFALNMNDQFIKTNDWKGSSTWANEELANAKNNGLIPEKVHEKMPTEGVTRKEFAAIAVKLFEAIMEKEIEVEIDNPFVDTSDEDVLKAYLLGITTGVSETEFAPDKLITREQMATMMARAIEKTGVKIDTKVNDGFADNNEISDWAKDSVYFMNEKEIIKGMENNMFKAKNTATREQAVVIAQRCLKNLHSFDQ